MHLLSPRWTLLGILVAGCSAAAGGNKSMNAPTPVAGGLSASAAPVFLDAGPPMGAPVGRGGSEAGQAGAAGGTTPSAGTSAQPMPPQGPTSVVRGPCNQSHATPGCVDSTVEECVCRGDARCCSAEWDAVCVGLVRGLQCKGDCCRAGQVGGCRDSEVERCVCARSQECCTSVWDEFCTVVAEGVCRACAEGK